MKKILILVLTIFSLNINAQIFTPVSWEFFPRQHFITSSATQ